MVVVVDSLSRLLTVLTSLLLVLLSIGVDLTVLLLPAAAAC